MTDRPIIFSGPMVRAILREINFPGTGKTQTRRIAKGVPDMPSANCHPAHIQKYPAPYLDAYCGDKRTPNNPRGMSQRWCWWQVDDRQCLPTFKVPYVPGDRLWVRETWAPLDRLTHNDPGCDALINGGFYRADQSTIEGEISRWTPAIHMPRRASRITLDVAEVRVQRLQDITESDAIAEGIHEQDVILGANCNGGVHREETGIRYFNGTEDDDFSGHVGAADAFAELWDGINAKRGFGWDVNPWVVAVTFLPRRGNIDGGGHG